LPTTHGFNISETLKLFQFHRVKSLANSILDAEVVVEMLAADQYNNRQPKSVSSETLTPFPAPTSSESMPGTIADPRPF